MKKRNQFLAYEYKFYFFYKTKPYIELQEQIQGTNLAQKSIFYI